MKEICITFPMIPVAKGRPRFDTRNMRTYTPHKTKDAENDIKWLAKSFMNKNGLRPLEGALRLKILFFMPKGKTVTREHHTTKPDLDNLLKLVKDAVNGIFWKDDSQVVDSHCMKLYETTENKPSTVVVVESLS